MKKWLLICFTVVFLISAVGCGSGDSEQGGTTAPTPKPTPTPTVDVVESGDLTMLRQTIIETPYIAAIGYLGYFDGDYDDLDEYLSYIGVTEYYSFLAEIPEDHYVEFEGQELYCIVPRDEYVEMHIYDWIIDEFNDYMGEVGECMFSGYDGQPVLVRGNVSEYIPNMFVELIGNEGEYLEYLPILSGMDGTLEVPFEKPWVMDITPYVFYENQYGYDYSFDEAVLYLYESWTTSLFTEDGEYLNASFTFYEDGTVQFCYGPEGDVYQYYYEGSFIPSLDSTDTYEMEFYLVNDYSDAQDGQDFFSEITFYAEPDSSMLSIIFAYGDPFGYEPYDAEYYLMPSVG